MNDDIKLIDISKDIYGLLVRFNEIKDSINRPSLIDMIRRVVPLPWIFQAVPYDEHKTSLERFLTELEEHKIAIDNLTDSFSGEKKDYIDLLSKYSICLSDSINLFLKIVTHQDDVANNRGNYKWEDYKNDEDRFEESFQSCSSLGGRLTQFYEKIF